MMALDIPRFRHRKYVVHTVKAYRFKARTTRLNKTFWIVFDRYFMEQYPTDVKHDEAIRQFSEARHEIGTKMKDIVVVCHTERGESTRSFPMAIALVNEVREEWAKEWL